MRMAVKAVLDAAPDFTILAEASNGMEALQLGNGVRPDVIVMDVMMPKLGGPEAARKLAAEYGVPIVALSSHADARLVDAMFDAGVRGYVLKDHAFDDLRDAVSVVVGGDTFVGEGITSAS